MLMDGICMNGRAEVGMYCGVRQAVHTDTKLGLILRGTFIECVGRSSGAQIWKKHDMQSAVTALSAQPCGRAHHIERH